MSSILIKGMTMPKDCRECPLQEYYVSSGNTLCFPTDRYLAEKYSPIGFEGRANWCPLVEVKTPHGRLIDERIAQQSIGYHMTGILGRRDGRSDRQRVHDGLAGTPTVIEAEE